MTDKQPKIHIHVPPGHYAGYLRRHGGKKFKRVTGNHDTPQSAMIEAMQKADRDTARAVVVFMDNEGWYEPTVVMELRCRTDKFLYGPKVGKAIKC